MTPQLKRLLDDARAWAYEQYELKGGQPGTDIYFQNKLRAMTELLEQIEKRETERND